MDGEIVDESICLICGGSTYQGETISCETCLHWFHFQCVGVIHTDPCVVTEDVPFFCPSCAVANFKDKFPSTSSSPLSNTSSNPLPRKMTTSPTKMRQKMKKSSKRKREIKLKISFNKKDEGDDYFEEEKGNSQDQDSSNVSQDSDSSIDQPLIIDEIAPRIVKVGRRRPSQRQGVMTHELKPEETLGFELKMEKLEALMKDQATPENVLDDLIEKPTKENILQEPLQSIKTEQLPSSLLSINQQQSINQTIDDMEMARKEMPRNLTARQRFKLEGIDSDDSLLALDFTSGKKKCETKENLADKALKAQKRKDIETEKKEKIKKKTVDTLLKKKDSKMTKQIKYIRPQIDDSTRITYISNAKERSLTFPKDWAYPLQKGIKLEPPAPILCCVCSNVKKYNCSKTGKPLCSLACYKANLKQVEIKSEGA